MSSQEIIINLLVSIPTGEFPKDSKISFHLKSISGQIRLQKFHQKELFVPIGYRTKELSHRKGPIVLVPMAELVIDKKFLVCLILGGKERNNIDFS